MKWVALFLMALIACGTLSCDVNALPIERRDEVNIVNHHVGPHGLGRTYTIKVDGATYIVVTTNNGIAICPTLETLRKIDDES